MINKNCKNFKLFTISLHYILYFSVSFIKYALSHYNNVSQKIVKIMIFALAGCLLAHLIMSLIWFSHL